MKKAMDEYSSIQKTALVTPDSNDGVPYTHGSINSLQVIVSIFKCVVGAGSFFLPYGIKQAGIFGGGFGVIIFGIFSMYLNYIIMYSKYKTFPHKPSSYADLCKKRLGNGWGYAMTASIILANLGACSIYIVTFAELLSLAFPQLSFIEYSAIILVGEVLISMLPSFKYLSFTSILGDICLVIAMVAVFVYGFGQNTIKPPGDYPGFIIKTYPYFFASAAFLFVQPSTLFPIANSMKKPKNFNKASTISYCIVTIVNVVFAVIAYMFFGDKTKSIVLENLCPDSTCLYVTIAQIALCIDVFFTYPVILVPATDVIEDHIFEGKVAHWKKIILRTLVNGVVFAVAVGVPNISELLNLISGIALCYNGFIMGPIVYLKTRRDNEYGLSLLLYVSHIAIVIFGFGIGGWTTYLGTCGVINVFTNSTMCPTG
eukprot:TRINITY_DN7515_c0_g1_i1.p1 TRINITY_DN7515_c0_g1~~TRINITY_DN7515_c0_g1_i1.p1  ORF type:complete len:428 (-),score=64.13 TRINITY_DN7515_c0_g1_i1:90-1373(-)